MLCDIQGHRITAKHHFFIESFPSPVMLLCNIHCVDMSSIKTAWEGCHTSGVLRTLIAPLYIFWPWPQPGAAQPMLCDPEQCWFMSTLSFCIYYKITTRRNSGFSVCTARVSNDPLCMTCKGSVSAKPLAKNIYLAKDRDTFLQAGFPQFLSDNLG